MYKVILVDDDRWARADIRASLESIGCGFEIAAEFENAPTALAWLDGHHADLIITDICMARQSGLDMIRVAREEGLDALYVIISGYDDFSYIQEAFRHQVFYYMLKPLNDGELRAMLERAHAQLDGRKKQTAPVGPTSEMPDLLSSVKAYIRERYAEEMTLDDLAKHFHVNSSYLSNLFTKKTGMTFSYYRNTIRIARAKALLEHGEMSVSEIAFDIGYSNLSYFNRMFKELVGVTPVQYRKEKNPHV